MLDDLLLAWGSGMLAGVNPCGFALLPAWLMLLLNNNGHHPIRLGMSMTGGFAVVFGAAGIAVGGLGWSVAAVGDVTVAASVISGLALVLLGVLTLLGRKPSWAGVQIAIQGRGAFGYGVVFALTSLACAFPLFLAGVVGTFLSEGTGPGLLTVTAYTAGMGTLVTGLSVLTSRGRTRQTQRLRTLGHRWDVVSGVALVAAGLLVVGRTAFGVELLDAVSREVTRLVDTNVWVVTVVLVTFPTVVFGIRRLRSHSRRNHVEGTR